MKAKYLFKALFSLLVALLCSYNSIAQDSIMRVQTIEIHPNGRSLKLPKYLKYGGFVQFEIKNVNNLLYNADVTVARSSYNYDEIPDIFIATKAVNLADLLTEEGNISEDFKQKQNFNKKIDQLKSFSETISALKATIAKIKMRAALHEELNGLIDGIHFIRDTKALKAKATSKFDKVYESDSVSIKSLFDQTELLYKELKKQIELIKSEFYHGLRKTKGSNDMQFENYFYAKNLEITQGQWKQVEDAYSKIKDEENRKKITEAVDAGKILYDQIQESEYVLYTPPVKVNSDLIELTPKLYGKKDTITIKGDYIFRSKGGFKVNFSAGYLLSFRGDEKYDLVKDSAGTSIGVKKGNSSGLTHALGGMVHVYPRGFRNYQPGFSAGISTSDNGDLGFHLGVSLLATEGNNRVVFSAGVSFTSLQQLNKGNLRNENGNLLFSSPTDTEIKYDNVYKPSFFVGLTFNLSKAADKQKDNKE